jgi:hypothetical protein
LTNNSQVFKLLVLFSFELHIFLQREAMPYPKLEHRSNPLTELDISTWPCYDSRCLLGCGFRMRQGLWRCQAGGDQMVKIGDFTCNVWEFELVK